MVSGYALGGKRTGRVTVVNDAFKANRRDARRAVNFMLMPAEAADSGDGRHA
jgi:hypothetical protein